MLGEKPFHDYVQRLSVNDLWLLYHIAIAFWHTFGIANGLRINPETDLKTVSYREGPDGHYVKAEVMQAKLDEYLRWLNTYQQPWGTQQYNQTFPVASLLQDVFRADPASWKKVVKMVELLQIGVPIDPSLPSDRSKEEKRPANEEQTFISS